VLLIFITTISAQVYINWVKDVYTGVLV